MYFTSNFFRIAIGASCASAWWMFKLYGKAPDATSGEFPWLFFTATILSIAILREFIVDGLVVSQRLHDADDLDEDDLDEDADDDDAEDAEDTLALVYYTERYTEALKARYAEALNLLNDIPLELHPPDFGGDCHCSQCTLRRNVKTFLLTNQPK